MMPVVVVSKLWICGDGILSSTHHVPLLTFTRVCVIHESCGVGWYVWRPGGGVDAEEQVA